ncbi:hypothetical protein PMI08_03139 [Brevibacillus sp. CF112]|uniref:hypothetical protein n=1 Tax=Brevibacillus sp. CF112 TaxID=1144311 RepID=UPI0002717F59|nr:hypothetical protein [Brevibacillus sp. CF112]EJL42488.1 hypothetical protein PMI08_03139 [Brevibacillus sp. CF112]
MIRFEIEPGKIYEGEIVANGYIPGSMSGFGVAVKIYRAEGSYARIGEVVFIPRFMLTEKPPLVKEPISISVDKAVPF